MTRPPTERDDTELDKPAEPNPLSTVDDDFLDLSRWPIIDITFPEVITVASLDRHFEAVLRQTSREEPHVAIVNLDALRVQNRELRQHAAKHLRRFHSDPRGEYQTKYLLGVAHVSDNWLSRATLTIVLNLSPPPYPNQVFRKQEAAEAWVRKLLAEYKP